MPKIEEEEALFAEDGVDSADPPPFYPAAAALVVSAGREEESEGNKARHEEEEGQSVRSRGSKVVSNARIEGLLEHRSSPQANRDKGEIDRQGELLRRHFDFSRPASKLEDSLRMVRRPCPIKAGIMSSYLELIETGSRAWTASRAGTS